MIPKIYRKIPAKNYESIVSITVVVLTLNFSERYVREILS